MDRTLVFYYNFIRNYKFIGLKYFIEHWAHSQKGSLLDFATEKHGKTRKYSGH